jgi:hypothetical protein
MSRYRDPLLRSAIDLQSRLFNIYKQYFLRLFYQRSQAERNYAIQNTLVCEGFYAQQGYVMSWLDAIDFNGAKINKSQLVNVASNRRSCIPPYHAVEIKDFTLQDGAHARSERLLMAPSLLSSYGSIRIEISCS